MKHLYTFLLGLAVVFSPQGLQAKKPQGATPARPKLVVGLVVDQMRWDYLHRFASRYGSAGFRRLLGEGYSFDNTHIPYVPTFTAVGHASIYTGSVPSVHGIVANDFYVNGQYVSSTRDTKVQVVGSTSVKEGQHSPHRLLATTMGDELRLATNFHARVFSISLKDRAAIMPGGHSSNGSFWLDKQTGRFITSTHYMSQLPSWAEEFNRQHHAKRLMDEDWHTLYPLDTYTLSTPDGALYEGGIDGQRTFPIRTSQLYKADDYSNISYLPQGNQIVLDFAKQCLSGEQLGKGGYTDFLAVSLSAPDYLGHNMGINAIEIEDMYLRLDRQLADFLRYLDEHVGRGQYLFFLCSDHGAAHNGRFLADRKIPSGDFMRSRQTKDLANRALRQVYGHDSLALTATNYQVYLDHARIARLGLSLSALRQTLVDTLHAQPGVHYAIDLSQARTAPIPAVVAERVVNGYHRQRSGDVQVVPLPAWYAYGYETGTQHGVWNPYDARIPLIFMGWGIKHGHTHRMVSMTDIAPTICALLNIQMPNGCVGQALVEVADR